MQTTKNSICYVLQNVGVHHPLAHERFDLVWYPERGMSFLDCVGYKPLIKSIVTENPYIIACYDSANVRVWEEGRWYPPLMQTYGTSAELIVSTLLGWKNIIPAMPLDGGVSLGKLRRKLEDERGMADATYHRKRKVRNNKIREDNSK